MSERESEQNPAEGGARLSEREPTPAVEPVSPPDGSIPGSREGTPRGSGRTALWLAGLVVLILGGIALSPFWAPQIEPLLPWSQNHGEYAALAGRVAAIEARSAPQDKEIDTVRSALNTLSGRVDQLETALDTRLADLEKRQTSASPEIGSVNSALSSLEGRIDHLEAAVKSDPQVERTIQTGVQQLEQRLTTLEAQSGSRMARETAASKEVEQQLARLDKANTDIADRIAALEREAQSQSRTELRADGMLALLLAQMREAMDQARPFPTEFDAFVRLAQDRELAAAAEPLAEAARNGVASRAVLSKRLAELGGKLTVTGDPTGEVDWGKQTLARLRGLVTIRRIDGSSGTGPEAAVSAARAALAGGDLAGAVAALRPLTEANSAVVRPWLQMAEERLRGEAALGHLQELLTARLGGTPATPGAAPAKNPEEPEKPRTRS
jgi:hypothetical protein